MQLLEVSQSLLLLVLTLAVNGRCDDEHHTDQANGPIGDVDTTDADQHADRQHTDCPVCAVFQIAELGQRPCLHELNGHRTHEECTDSQTSSDQHDRVGDREGRRHTVERERTVLDFEVDEEPDSRHAKLDRLLRVLVVLVVEDIADQTDADVQHDAANACDQQTQHVLSTHQQRPEQHEQASHEKADVVELADLRQRVLDRTEPLDITLLEKIVEEDEQQVDPTEHRDVRVCFVQLLGVAAGVVERQRDHVAELDLRREGDDSDREDEAHTKYRDRQTDPQERPLPARAHPFEHLGVNHGVVERERDLQDQQNEQWNHRER